MHNRRVRFKFVKEKAQSAFWHTDLAGYVALIQNSPSYPTRSRTKLDVNTDRVSIQGLAYANSQAAFRFPQKLRRWNGNDVIEPKVITLTAIPDEERNPRSISKFHDALKS